MKTIVIGAGAAGLMAAYELSRNGGEVVVLEAQDRIGGRVHTFTPNGFSNFIEAGAEFVHGPLPLTLALLKKAKLDIVEASMDMTSFKNGKFVSGFDSKHWETFAKRAFEVKRDCTLSQFLGRYFSHTKYEALRRECYEMAQGLDLADPEKLSLFCIRDEWTSSEPQFRPVSGYAALLGFLADSIASQSGRVVLNQKATWVRWKKGSVEIHTETDVLAADNAIITTTLGNLQQREIAFDPKFDDGFSMQ